MLITSNFSFSRSVFKKFIWQTRKNQGLFGKGLNQYGLQTWENHVGNGENAGTHHFLLFQQCFLYKRKLLHLSNIEIIVCKMNASKLHKGKILS